MPDFTKWCIAKCPNKDGPHEVSVAEEVRFQEVLDDKGNAFQAPMKICIHCDSAVIFEQPTPISLDNLSSPVMRRRARQLSGQPPQHSGG